MHPVIRRQLHFFEVNRTAERIAFDGSERLKHSLDAIADPRAKPLQFAATVADRRRHVFPKCECK